MKFPAEVKLARDVQGKSNFRLRKGDRAVALRFERRQGRDMVALTYRNKDEVLVDKEFLDAGIQSQS